MVGFESYSLMVYGDTAVINHMSGEILTLIQSVSVFMIVRILFENIEISEIIKTMSACSFGIYLIHPFWINLIYKVLDITPLSMPIGFGIVVLFIVVIVLSFCTTRILKNVPIISKIM